MIHASPHLTKTYTPKHCNAAYDPHKQHYYCTTFVDKLHEPGKNGRDFMLCNLSNESVNEPSYLGIGT